MTDTTVTRHPAKFNDAILDAVRGLLPPPSTHPRILDPFAGTGRVHELRKDGYITTGIELEPEWADMSPYTMQGNALDLPFADNAFDVIVTSPTYGNRMADHHEAKDGSRRNTYRHALGRPLSPDNSGALQWGEAYRGFHYWAWTEAVRVLRPGGVFILNCKDHIRGGVRKYVTDWHIYALERIGLYDLCVEDVPCSGNRQGANGALRVECESIIRMGKPR